MGPLMKEEFVEPNSFLEKVKVPPSTDREVIQTPVSPSLSLRTPSPALLSRHKNVSITCDVKGNLGPCTVLNQDPPGSDWLKDR